MNKSEITNSRQKTERRKVAWLPAIIYMLCLEARFVKQMQTHSPAKIQNDVTTNLQARKHLHISVTKLQCLMWWRK